MSDRESMTCGLWYWRYSAVYVDLYARDAEAAEAAVAMEDAEEASVAGVQYEDGIYVPRDEWPAHKAERERRDEVRRAEYEEQKNRPQRPVRKVTPPFDTRGQMATVLADAPSWLGANKEPQP